MHQSGPRLKAGGSWFLTALLNSPQAFGDAFNPLAGPRQPRKAVCNVGGKAEINIKRELERYVVKIDPWPSVDPPVPTCAASGAIPNTVGSHRQLGRAQNLCGKRAYFFRSTNELSDPTIWSLSFFSFQLSSCLVVQRRRQQLSRRKYILKIYLSSFLIIKKVKFLRTNNGLQFRVIHG